MIRTITIKSSIWLAMVMGIWVYLQGVPSCPLISFSCLMTFLNRIFGFDKNGATGVYHIIIKPDVIIDTGRGAVLTNLHSGLDPSIV